MCCWFASIYYCRGFCSGEIVHMFVYWGRYCIPDWVSPPHLFRRFYTFCRIMSCKIWFLIRQARYVWASWGAIGHIWQSCCIFKRFVATSVHFFFLFLLETICMFYNRIYWSLPSLWYIYIYIYIYICSCVDRGNESPVAAVWWKSFVCICP